MSETVENTVESPAPADNQPEQDNPETEASSDTPAEPTFEEKMDAELKKNPRVIKVNGKERQIKSWAEWERYGAREMAAEERFQEAKRIKEEADELRKAVESGDLLTLLKKRGLDHDGMKGVLRDVVNKLVEEEDMDPRDRKIREYEAREKAAKEAEEASKREAEEKANRVRIEAKAKEYVEQISDAAERLGLVSDPFLLGQVANELKTAYDEGVELSVDSAVRLVRDNFVEQYAEYVRRLPLELKKSIFGEEALKELQESVLAGAKTGKRPTPVDARKDSTQADDDDDFDPIGSATARHERKMKEKMSSQDFFRKLQLGEI